MFAFAFWDREERALFLARDRMGEKPLYYGWQNGVFLFGSELKALAAHPAFEGDVDRDALTLLLRHGLHCIPLVDLQGSAKAAGGHLRQSGGRRFAGAAGRRTAGTALLLVVAGRGSNRPGGAIHGYARRRGRRPARPVARRSARPDGRGRAARRLPLRRSRLLCCGRVDAGAIHAAGANFHHRIRRIRIQRSGARQGRSWPT